MSNKVLYNKITQEFKRYPRNDDKPIVGLDEDTYDVFEEIKNSPPNYDPDTEKLVSEWVVDLSKKTRTLVYTKVKLSQEEIYTNANSNLNWNQFAYEMFDNDENPNSPYSQLVDWCASRNKLVVLLNQLTACVLTVKDSNRLKKLFTRLKKTINDYETIDFTPEQVAELNRLFGILGTNGITWETL